MHLMSAATADNLGTTCIVVMALLTKSHADNKMPGMAAINKFVSTKNSRMFFPDFFFNVTSHLTNYGIDVDILKIFLKLFFQFLDIYFFDNQQVIFNICYEQFRAYVL